ncbi:WD40/YVTN repeat-like-containing domain protein [Moelleriella libera RCEF 2490]|uniref:WD40/YVTN repeat-like-containing domain protein n=1 Tax=Moelleriella libera RCEF 2490 TaxID=1081109 RepID=A0A168BYJ9_9HYPO|nr:WD40/YVTN repeat-like-containing domain protein [Moelleriella libera RCEF 2490]
MAWLIIAAPVRSSPSGSNNDGSDYARSEAHGNAASDAVQSHASSAASSPSGNTPETSPPPAAAIVDHGNHGAPSPLLDALSTTSASPDTAPSLTNEWAKSVMAGSPTNLISLTSESPPTQPSSYEDSARLHNGWAAAHRPFMSPSPASPSPPSGSRRPLSFHLDAQHQQHHHHFTGAPPRSTSTAYRRTSLHSPYTPSQPAAAPRYPPLPHQPQSHFYGVRDLDLTVTPQSGMKAGDHGFFFGFDELPSRYASTARAEKVVLAGYQGGLQVYSVSKKDAELVGGLKGLRGGVHHAKILPWTVAGDKAAAYPLVAVVVHGPVLPPRSTEADARPTTACRATPDDATDPRPSYAQTEPYPSRSAPPPIQSYQTSVEVYSLHTNKLVDVLLETTKTAINTEVSLSSPLFHPPPPSGAFTIKADAGVIAVCSGVTGECWTYKQLVEPQNGHFFACTAKVWTTLQHSQRPADMAEEADKVSSAATASAPASAAPRSAPQTAVFALSGRWIAFCPANPSSQTSLRAHLPVPTLGRAPGVSSLAPPHLPAPSAAVDLPIADGMMNKFMRERTQDLISGMKWVGQQGFQAWTSYWSQPPSGQTHQQQARSPPGQWTGPRTAQPDASTFPPTHGASIPATAAAPKDPGLVSIVDVEAFPVSATIHPLGTFATPLGCSFLSFSPSALALFTASAKGDVQTVWDLFRLQHTNSSPLQTTLSHQESIGPHVRQIAQFSRMTVARIVEVAWTEPYGDRLAMVTERGTIHLLDMPFSSFMWPPPRRRKKMARKPSAEASETANSAVSIASGALGAAYQAARPFVSRSRRGSSNNNNNSSSSNTISPTAGTSLRDSAAQGGRVIAASISHSLGKTGTAISQLRHTGENRVSLPSSSTSPSVACVSWLRGRRSQSLCSVGGGTVRVFPCKTRTASSAPGKKVSRANKHRDIKVPLLPHDALAPLIHQLMESGAADEFLDFSEAEMDTGNTMTLKASRAAIAAVGRGADSTIPQAEIESSAPYQPFHTDRRVAFCEYGRVESTSVLLAMAALDSGPVASRKKGKAQTEVSSLAAPVAKAWAFGQDITAVKLDPGFPAISDEESLGPDDHMALPQSAMERVMQFGGSEQIVVTTRRRRGARPGDGDGDGFFEDDCEVLDFADQRV